MFKKLAQLLVFGAGCARQSRATSGYRADGQPDRRLVAHSHRARRPTLICGWRKVPSGALECHWQAIDLAEADPVAPRRDRRATQSPTGARATGKRPFTPAAA
jgi:hypothetical protein